MKKSGKLLILAGILALCAVVLVAAGLISESRSVGIIGGADGPTAILVTTTK